MWAPRFLLLLVVAVPGAVLAQDVAGLPPSSASSSSRATAMPELPAAPSATQMQASRERFRAEVDAPPALRPRLTVGDKFQLFMEHSQSPFTFTAAGVAAGVGQVAGTDPGFGQGWRGYRRRYGAALADNETHAFFSKFLIPVLAHQDPRYKRNGREAFGARVFDALSQIVETESDDGEVDFNYSQVLGTAVSASISNTYYPVQLRGFRRTGYRAVTRLATEAGMNVVREFLPDIKRAFFGRPKVTEREREALSWRTGAQRTVTPEGK